MLQYIHPRSPRDLGGRAGFRDRFIFPDGGAPETLPLQLKVEPGGLQPVRATKPHIKDHYPLLIDLNNTSLGLTLLSPIYS